MPDNRNTPEYSWQNAATASRQRANERSAQMEASPRQSVQAIVDAMKRDSANRLNAAQNDAPRWQQDAQQYQHQNCALRDRSQWERENLSKRTDAFATQQNDHVEKSEKRATVIADRLAETARRLETQQRSELQRASPADTQQLQEHHAEQWRALRERSTDAKSELAELRERDNQLLKDQRLAVDKVLMNGSNASINKTMDDLDLAKQREWERSAGNEHQSKHRDMDALSHAVRNTAAEISGSLSPDRAQQWRARLGEIAKNLDDDAIARIRLAGERVSNPDQAVNAFKGQLFEELMTTKQEIEKMVAAAQKELDRRGIEAKAEFISGDRIRDESGFRKLTDGIIEWKDESDRLHVMKYLEAKSGSDYADKLLRATDDRTWKKDQVAAQDAGQLVMTGERLRTNAEQNQAIYIDGRRTELAEWQRGLEMDAVVPRDVKQKVAAQQTDTTAQTNQPATEAANRYVEKHMIERLRDLDVTEQEIRDAAARAVDLREDERKTAADRP